MAMSDKERVHFMQDMNWKPASQYWHEQYQESQLSLEKETYDKMKLLQALKNIDDFLNAISQTGFESDDLESALGLSKNILKDFAPTGIYNKKSE